VFPVVEYPSPHNVTDDPAGPVAGLGIVTARLADQELHPIEGGGTPVMLNGSFAQVAGVE